MKHRLVNYIQNKIYIADNSYQSKKDSEEKQFGSGILINDIPYGKTYPNSFLDLYKSRKNQKAPLIIYAHGGGFTWGSKEDGDPNAGKVNGDKYWFFKKFLEEGYDIVSYGYAFAPECMYPTPVLQLHEAIRFLQGHADEYALDLDHIILCGSSAGGNIVGQYAAIQTNPRYAAEMKMEQILHPKQIQCVLFNSALIDPTRYDVVHSMAFDYLLRKCGQAYYGEKVMKTAKGAFQSNLLFHADKNYPASFISDANTGSFYDQARDFYELLKRMDIKTELNIYPKSEAKLSHGYESMDTKYGRDNMAKMLRFMKETSVGGV